MTGVGLAVEETTRRVRAGLAADVISPWHIFWHLRRLRQGWEEREISRAAEEVLATLISEGAVVGTVDREILAVRAWPRQHDVLGEVSGRWRLLGRDPAPGEIGYLDKPAVAPGPTADRQSQPAVTAASVAGSGTQDAVVAQAVDELWEELDDDVIGPWDIFAALRDVQGHWTEEAIDESAEAVLAGLLARGAVFGDLARLADDFEPWPDQEDAVERVVRAWDAMDRDPGLGEVCWIMGPDVLRR